MWQAESGISMGGKIAKGPAKPWIAAAGCMDV
jgi:hypothetical protein